MQVGFTGTLCNSCQGLRRSTRSICECPLEKNGDRGFARGIRNRGSRFSLNTERYRKEGSRGREKTARGGRNVGEKREKTQNYLVQGRTGSGVFSLHVINILNGLFLYEFFLIVEFRIKGNFLKKLRLV